MQDSSWVRQMPLIWAVCPLWAADTKRPPAPMTAEQLPEVTVQQRAQHPGNRLALDLKACFLEQTYSRVS